jgi:hypothetical protein
VAARPAGSAGWAWWRVGVEAAVGTQPHQHRHTLLGQVKAELGGVVAAVEHKPWRRRAGGQPLKQRADLRRGGVVGVVQGMQPPGVDQSGPGVTLEADLSDPLIGPAGDDRLAGGVARGVVVVTPLGRALGVAARPGGHIHREHQRVGILQEAHQQVAQPLGVDAAVGQGGVDAAPAALMDWLQAQVRQRQEAVGAQQRVAELE